MSLSGFDTPRTKDTCHDVRHTLWTPTLALVCQPSFRSFMFGIERCVDGRGRGFFDAGAQQGHGGFELTFNRVGTRAFIVGPNVAGARLAPRSGGGCVGDRGWT